MADSSVPQVQDKRPKIAGLLPKNAQARVLTGIAFLMILVMMFSGRKSAPTKAASSTIPTLAAMDPNAGRIQEYRARIEEASRQLASEEAQLTQTKQALGVRMPAPGLATPMGTLSAPASAPAYTPAPEKNWIELDREKREYQGLYASNVALTYRSAEPDTPVSKTPFSEHAETLPASGVAGAAPKTNSHAVVSGAPPYRLFEGTIIETVLTNRLDSSFSGPVNCMVTTPVYAADHQTLLIPAGARVLGDVRKLEALGEQRLAVSFHRMIMPDGSSVSLDQFKGLDQIGQTGLLDQVNHHYLQIFGVSLAIGAIAGLSNATTRYNADESAAQAYEQGVSESLSRSSLHILDRYLNVLPTFTIREGHRIKIYLSQDLLLPAYGEHPLNDSLIPVQEHL